MLNKPARKPKATDRPPKINGVAAAMVLTIAVGLPMAIGGSVLLEIVFGVLFAVGVVAWSATALVFGRVPALASAVLLLVYPAWATLYHQASSDAVFATGLALWALVLARALRWPSTSGFVVHICGPRRTPSTKANHSG